MAKRNNGKTAVAASARVRPPVVPPNGVPTTFDHVRALARTVTPATFDRDVERATRNHGVTLAGRNVGRFTGQRITAFQNMLMASNASSSWQFDDVQLAFIMRVEHPSAVGRVYIGTVADRVSIVRGIRADYNRNGHGMPTGKPAIESESYGARRFDFGPVTSTVPAASPAPKRASAAPIASAPKPRLRKTA